jgi:uncharacterized protein YqeY
MTRPSDDNLHERLRRALPAAMKARNRPAVTALRSALAAIDNAGAVDPAQAPSAGGDQGPASLGAVHSEFAGTVAGVGATEVARRRLSQAQMEEIVRAEIADRETAAAGYDHAGQLDPAERLRAEAEVLRAYLNPS